MSFSSVISSCSLLTWCRPRYAGHEQNKKDAAAQRGKILEKTVKYREVTGSDPKFLVEALELLIQVRIGRNCLLTLSSSFARFGSLAVSRP